MPLEQTKNYCRERVRPPSAFDKRSFRTVKRGKARIVVACPKGHWDAKRKRCKVGLRAQTILHRGACPVRRR